MGTAGGNAVNFIAAWLDDVGWAPIVLSVSDDYARSLAALSIVGASALALWPDSKSMLAGDSVSAVLAGDWLNVADELAELAAESV